MERAVLFTGLEIETLSVLVARVENANRSRTELDEKFPGLLIFILVGPLYVALNAHRSAVIVHVQPRRADLGPGFNDTVAVPPEIFQLPLVRQIEIRIFVDGVWGRNPAGTDADEKFRRATIFFLPPPARQASHLLH